MSTTRPRITQARLKELMHYDPETGVFTRIMEVSSKAKVGQVPGGYRKGYRVVCIDRVTYMVHRLAWLYVHGQWPEHSIDHINGVRDDNRLANLRDVPIAVNLQNRLRAFTNSKTGLLGVYPKRGRFAAAIEHEGAVYSLGSYITPEEAHEVYLAKKRELHPGCTI